VCLRGDKSRAPLVQLVAVLHGKATQVELTGYCWEGRGKRLATGARKRPKERGVNFGSECRLTEGKNDGRKAADDLAYATRGKERLVSQSLRGCSAVFGSPHTGAKSVM